MQRFAVGAFSTWSQVRQGLGDAHRRGLVMDRPNLLALERVFAGNGVVSPSRAPLAVLPLPFPGDAALVACTPGPVADRLIGRLHSGARSLREALGHWLIPRHAADFEQTVQAGKI